MMPKLFVTLVVVGVSLLVAVGRLPLPERPLDVALALCHDVPVVIETKLDHVRRSPAYEVILFGNSRLVSVPTESLGLPDGRKLNMAVGGTSFRQSVALLEEVVSLGKAPRVAVLSFDHVSLIYAQRPYHWPPFPLRAVHLARDGHGLAVGQHTGAADLRQFGKTLTGEELQNLARLVNIKLLSDRVSAAFGLEDPANQKCGSWRGDGSFAGSPKHHVTADLNGASPTPWTVYDARYPLLEMDLERLARIQRAGVRVMVYESPIIPQLRDVIQARLPPESIELRQRLFDGCTARGLLCRQAPDIYGSPQAGYWIDENHAPPQGLGEWIGKQLQTEN